MPQGNPVRDAGKLLQKVLVTLLGSLEEQGLGLALMKNQVLLVQQAAKLLPAVQLSVEFSRWWA